MKNMLYLCSVDDKQLNNIRYENTRTMVERFY